MVGDTGRISMLLLPEGECPAFENRRNWLDKEHLNSAWEVGSLCHLALRQYAQSNGAGGTLKYGETAEQLKLKEQIVEEKGNQIKITTELLAEEYAVFHIVTYTKGEKGIEVETIFQNRGKRILTLDMITSFSLDNLSPVQEADGAYSLYLHRFHGGWSLEGKHQADSVEQLNLGGTWIRAFPESERYGAVGSFPVKRWFPFGSVEDREKEIFWAAQLGVNSSWQMEFSRDGDCYSLSGGVGDCETSAWWKDVRPGEKFHTPKAYISVGRTLEDVCQNITGMFQKYADNQPECEALLPIWFNEWCSSWGNPTHTSVTQVKESLKGFPVKGIVIDAGWSTQPEGAVPQEGNGDWQYDRKQFPQGLKVVAKELEQEQMYLGLWMEFEVTTSGAKVHENNWDRLHLKRGGEVIQTGDIRRFWDFRKAETIEYLREKVVNLLKENNIRYLKVDYNGSIGMGCDGAESPGEGLRQQMEAVYQFFCMIRREIPELVIENCASGGHRLEPMMMSVTALSSFSDAHECVEIPYIAANLHYLILPRQSLIWAVIRSEFTKREINYRMASTLLGRMCLSGDMEELREEQKQTVLEGCRFYQKCVDVIKNGKTQLVRHCSENPHHLYGYQAVLRHTDKELLVVFHSFENSSEKIEIDLPVKKVFIKDSFGEDIHVEISGNSLILRETKAYQAYAVLFQL